MVLDPAGVLDRGEKAFGIFLDSVDTVDHILFFKVFNCYGISVICLCWFKSYLNRILNEKPIRGDGLFNRKVIYTNTYKFWSKVH